MADIQKPNTQELAPASQSASVMAGPYLEPMMNPDSVMSSRGGTFKVYDEVARDDQVKATFQQRRLAVVSSPWEVDPGIENNRAAKKAADALRELLKRNRFDDITDKQLWAVFWGYGVGEVMWKPNGSMIDFDIKVRDRSRFRFDVNGGLWLQKQTGQYEQMPDRKFWVVSTGADNDDNHYGLGLAHWLYWLVYFKRNDIKFWLIFLEKFGMPTAKAVLPAGKAEDVEFRKKVLNALRSIATDTAFVVPEGVEVELIEATRSGTGTYDTMVNAMNAAISKVCLSQTMTTDDGSSKSQAEVHGGVRDMVIKADADLICESFNSSVVKWWCEYNFGPNVAPPRVWRRTEPEEDLNKRAERDAKIISLGYEPTEEYITETYGQGWVKKQAATQLVDALGNPLPPGAQPNTNLLKNSNQAGSSPDQDADFAEIAAMATAKINNRRDQAAIVDAARRFAADYEGVLGQQVEQLVAFADQSGDFETFSKHLADMMARQPSQQTVEKLKRAHFVSRLMGAMRGQR